MEARKFRTASIDNRLPLLHEALGNPFPNSRLNGCGCMTRPRHGS